MTISDQAKQAFYETYMVSNTPSFLLRKLRQLPSVQALSAQEPRQLVDEYRKLLATEERTPTDVATIYACLVALTLSKSDDAFTLLKSLDTTMVEWASDIVSLHTARVAPWNNLQMPMVKGSSSQYEIAASSTTITNIKSTTPKIITKGNI